MSLPVTAIARVGVLTRDCRAAAAEYARFFGVNDWRVADCAGRTADGRDYAHRQAVGYAGAVGFELLEPQTGPWADLLAAGGEPRRRRKPASPPAPSTPKTAASGGCWPAGMHSAA